MTDRKTWQLKAAVFAVLVIIVFALLILRLFQLQVLGVDAYARAADKNRARVLSISAMRGNIYDTNMLELAGSKPVFAIAVSSVSAAERKIVAQNLAELFNDPAITAESIEKTLKEHYRRYEPVVIKRFVYEEGLTIVSRIEERRGDFPGVMITEEPMRNYAQGSLAGHILGTVGMISQSELASWSDYGYLVTDWVGKSGIERSMERFELNDRQMGLRGVYGVKQVAVNSKNIIVQTISAKDPIPGNSLVLTIDSGLQAAMENALAEVVARVKSTNPLAGVGSAVLIDVNSGAILAMASYPSMDPNDFANGLSAEKRPYYYNDEPGNPLFNYAVQGQYPPGSTFKMVTAMAALESGAVKPTDTPVYCTGAGLRPGSSPCIGRHGNVNLATALAVSCNTYFQEVALKSGIDAIYDAGLSMGLGRRTGIELPGEAAGILPNPAYKRLRFAPDDWEYNWHNYDTFNTAIGQGYNLYTPLQLANYVAAIANGGKHMQPYLLDKIISGTDGKVLFQAAPRVLNTLDISAENLAVVQLGMRMAVQPGGTAAGAFAGFPLERFPVAAKTGTAQVNSLAQDFHGVYVAYAPANNPQVAFACVIEYGRTGGGSAGLVCRAVFEQYFGLNPQPIPNELPESME